MTKMARQGIKARTQRTQGKACHHHRQGIGKARTQGKDARHRQLPSARHHRHAIGMPSAIAIGIGMPSASASSARHRHAIGMPSSAAAGRSSRTAERSKVAQYSHTDFERVLRCAVVKIFE
jgi:hypothetical protein